jgi:hypothetical protein
MRVVPLRDVLGLQSGETVPSVRGRITRVWDRKTGTNSTGDWAIQNLLLKDDSGAEIKVKVTDRDAIPGTWKGKLVYIACNEGKHGLTGIKAKDDDYGGKVNRILSVTPTAAIELADASQSTPPPEQQTQPPPPQQQQQQPKNGNGSGSGNAPTAPPTTAAEKISTAAHVRARDYYRVMEAAHAMRLAWDKAHPEHQMTPDHFQGACSTLYIQLQRDGVINGN